MRKRLWWSGKIVVSFVLIIFLLQRVDIGQLGKHIVGVDIKYILLAILTFLINWMLYTYKWQILLTALGILVSFKSLFILNVISIFYSLFLPGQISGEVVKGIKLIKAIKGSSKVLTSIIVDRVTGFFALILIALVGLFATPSFIGGYKLTLIAGMILLTIIFFTVITLNKRISSFIERASQPIFQIGALKVLKEYLLRTIWNSLKSYRENLLVLRSALIYSFIFQLITTVNLYMVCLAVDVRISFAALLWIFAIVRIIQMLPVSIAGIGVREGSYVFLFGQYGIPDSKALAFSLISFALTILWGLVGGLMELLSHFERRELNQNK